MYDELVKRLREAVGNRDEKCESCPHTEDYPCCIDCLDKLHREAADAIKILCEAVAEAHNMMANMEQDKPRWISVEERLPERGVFVLAAEPRYADADEGPYDILCREQTEEGTDIWVDTDGDGVGCLYDEYRYWMSLPAPPEVEK